MPTKTKKTEYRAIQAGCLKDTAFDNDGVDLIFTDFEGAKLFRVRVYWWGAAEIVERLRKDREKHSEQTRANIAALNKRFGIE